MLLILAVFSLAALAEAQCQAAYGGFCVQESEQPCCNPAWSCLRHSKGQCGSSDPFVEQFRCGVAGGSAPPASQLAQEAPPVEQATRTTTERVLTNGAEPTEVVFTETTAPAEPCSLVCRSSVSLLVSPSAPTPVPLSDLVRASESCGAISANRQEVSCADLGDRVLTVTAASGHACQIALKIEAAAPQLRCRPDLLQFTLSAVNEFVFGRTDVAETRPVCGEQPAVLHSPPMLVCTDVPRREVQVFFGNASVVCPVAVVGPTCSQ
jgi:hypothetical protein